MFYPIWLAGKRGVCTFQRATVSLLATLATSSALSDVQQVEPPSWWVGMQHSSVEILLRGEALSGAQVDAEHSTAKIIAQHDPGNGHSLFVTVDLSEVNTAGDVTFDLVLTSGKKQTIQLPIQTRESSGLKGAGFDQGDMIYLITPDRFANGNVDNDVIPGLLEAESDRSEPYGRHGGDLAGIEANLDYLESLGVTRLWMNPILENDMPESSYHGYAITDLYRVDPRYGSFNELKSLAEAAASRDIGLVWDAVPNHIGRQHSWMAQPPEANWIHPEQSSGISNHRREVLLDPHRVEDDVSRFANGWFVSAMPDLNQQNPRLARYLLQNMIWWIESLGISAVRVDTMPYNDRQFMADWLAGLLEEYPKLSVVGEEWSYQPSIVAQWQALGSPSMMDFPLNEAILKSLVEDESWNSGIGRLYQTLAADWLYPASEQLVIFPDNHDMSRVHTALGEDLSRTRMAIALTATLRGTPQIFYGTELLLSHPGTDSHGALRMDFPGGWPGDISNGFTGAGLSPEATEFQQWFRALFTWRRSSKAIGSGDFKHLAPVNGLYAFLRESNGSRVLVLVNNQPKSAAVDGAWLASLTSISGSWTTIPEGDKRQLVDDVTMPGKTVWILEQD